ncbi:hypothetical protein RI367_003423 [Sorochytrium milnesiophthora]
MLTLVLPLLCLIACATAQEVFKTTLTSEMIDLEDPPHPDPALASITTRLNLDSPNGSESQAWMVFNTSDRAVAIRLSRGSSNKLWLTCFQSDANPAGPPTYRVMPNDVEYPEKEVKEHGISIQFSVSKVSSSEEVRVMVLAARRFKDSHSRRLCTVPFKNTFPFDKNPPVSLQAHLVSNSQGASMSFQKPTLIRAYPFRVEEQLEMNSKSQEQNWSYDISNGTYTIAHQKQDLKSQPMQPAQSPPPSSTRAGVEAAATQTPHGELQKSERIPEDDGSLASAIWSFVYSKLAIHFLQGFAFGAIGIYREYLASRGGLVGMLRPRLALGNGGGSVRSSVRARMQHAQ